MSEERLVSKGIKSGVIEVGKKTIMKTYSWKPRLIVLNKGLIAVYSVNLVCLILAFFHFSRLFPH